MRNLLRAFRCLQLLLLAAVLVSVGCAEEVESPAIEIQRLRPDLFCDEKFPQGGIEVLGKGFTPMPFRVVEGPAAVELPTVRLKKGRNLADEPEPGPTIEFSGKPGGLNADRLSWQSEERMTLDFAGMDQLEPGLYGVTVTQPDGSSKDELVIGLAVVAAPTITGLEPPALCSAFQDEILSIVGSGFISVGDAGPTVTLERSGTPKTYAVDPTRMTGCTQIVDLAEPVQICSSISITIPGGDLSTGQYSVSVTNPETADCSTAESVMVSIRDDGPVIFYADPPILYNGVNSLITLYLTSITGAFTVELVPTGVDQPRTELEASLVPGRTNRVQATVPKDTASGVYDILVTDESGCSARLSPAVEVVSDLTLTLSAMNPPFGFEGESVPVTIQGDGFRETPRAFLNPHETMAGDVAIQLQAVTFISPTELTAVVPKGTAAKVYDLIVVNAPDENGLRTVGRLENAYTSLAMAPPVITDVLPQSIVNAGGQTITVQGTGFSGAIVSLECQDLAGQPVMAPSVTTTTETCDANGACMVTATIDASSLPEGAICIVRITNTDLSYGDFSAIGVTNSSFNLSDPKPGTPLNLARRALSAASAKATAASRFVYAIGGDGGSGAPFASVEFAPVSVFGVMSAWLDNGEALTTARAFAGSAQIGRYAYVFGGSDGTNALASGERAMILSPEEVPFIEDIDLCLSGGAPCYGNAALGGGLGEGEYSYRVSAVISATDPQNLGGETLASDPIILKLPSIETRGVLVRLIWAKPLDSQDAPLTGISGYRIYRTPVNGAPGTDEVLLAEVTGAETLEYIDDGSDTLGTERPLTLGSTSAWQSLPNLGAARNGPAGAAARDPSAPNTWYVYALLGKDSGSETGGTALTSYELLEVTTLPNGHQTVGTSWQAGADDASVGRWQTSAWVADSAVASVVTAPDSFVYVGPGRIGSGSIDGAVDAGQVAAGGDLGTFISVSSMPNPRAGYGVAAAASRLFAFGGSTGSAVKNAVSAQIVSPPTLAGNAWNSEGLQMTTERYLLGSSVQSAFIFLIGGVNAAGQVQSSTELVVW